MDQRANRLNILTQGVNDQAYIVIFGHIVQLLSSFEKFIMLGKEGRKKQKIMMHIKVDELTYSTDPVISVPLEESGNRSPWRNSIHLVGRCL